MSVSDINTVKRAVPRCWESTVFASFVMDRATRIQLGLAARQRVMENYNLPQIVSRYERLFEELAGKSLSQELPSFRKAYVRD